jgi:hypothetical protein
MLTKLDAQGILAEIKANNRRLQSCPQHRFPEGARFGVKWVCMVCGGKLDAGHALAYADGVNAAGGDARAVWSNYEPIR